MKKFYLIGLVAVICLLTACSETAAPEPSSVKPDDLEIVTLTESSSGSALYFEVAVKNNASETIATASVQFSLLNGERVVDDGSAFFETLRAGQEESQKAAFYSVLKNAGAYTCYRYNVTVSSVGSGEVIPETKSYGGTCQ